MNVNGHFDAVVRSKNMVAFRTGFCAGSSFPGGGVATSAAETETAFHTSPLVGSPGQLKTARRPPEDARGGRRAGRPRGRSPVQRGRKKQGRYALPATFNL
ncbi:hypothetical protein GCM10009530_73350 [Microbispora corallina]|uniref:Uncharacterized protein n=1 Tax=Microbispora corallina TaxID=83302 RepID=A0ABQ4GAP5_9ACTN|nr:hypothetical protein Mco01_71300 [Microbispora corallina]